MVKDGVAKMGEKDGVCVCVDHLKRCKTSNLLDDFASMVFLL